MQFKQVLVKQLKLDWIRASYHGFDDVGFKQLIYALDRAPHESLFSTALIKTLTEHFREYYYKRILLLGFLPFCIYFSCNLWWVSYYAVEGITEEESKKFTIELFLRIIIIISVIYFSFFEFMSMVRDGWDYILDIFNWFDWIAFFFNIYIIAYIVNDSKPDADAEGADSDPDGAAAVDTGDEEAEGPKDNLQEDRHQVRTMAAISILFMWFKVFYWMRLFSKTSFYIRLILETLNDVKYFLILFMTMLMLFGNATYIMNQGRTADGQIYKNMFNFAPIDVVLDQFRIANGDHDVITEGMQVESKDMVMWVFFVMSVLLTQITFLNMLIGIMGETFGRVSENREQMALKEKIKILADYAVMVRRSPKDKDKFLYQVTSTEMNNNDGDNQEGSLTVLKRAIERSAHENQAFVNKRLLGITEGMEMMDIKMASLE